MNDRQARRSAHLKSHCRCQQTLRGDLPWLAAFSFCLIGVAFASPAEEKITYEDQVAPIFRNHCFNCHNADKSKGDLDLSTYSALLKGGGSGKAVLPGDAEGSKLFKSIAQTEEPFMPNSSPRIPDAEIEVVRKWIAGGLLERSSSQAMASAKPKLELGPKAGSASQPGGPAILPVEWSLEPCRRTERATAVTALAGAPWSPLMAVGGQRQLLLYQSATLELAGVLPIPDGNPECVRFSRDGHLLVIGGGHAARLGFVDLYDVVTAKRIARIGNEYDSVLAADLNSDQTQVALGGPAKHLKIFSTRDGTLLRDLKKHTDWITALEYSPDSVLLASGDRNGGLMVWEADTGQELYTLTGHQAAITSLSWRDDSQVLLSASEDGSIHLWDMREGQEVAKWTAHRDGVLDARFARDARIVSCGRDRQVALWDAGGKKQRGWEAGADLPVRVAFSHDGTRIFTASWSGQVGVWLAADGKPVGEVTPNPPTLAERLETARKEAETKETALKKSEETLAAAEAETAKLKALLASAESKVAETKAAAEKSRAEFASAKTIVAGLKVAQAQTALCSARETVAVQQQEHEKLLAALAAAEAENARAATALKEVQTNLAALADKLKTLKPETETALQSAEAARTALNEAAQVAAKRPEDESTVSLLVDKRNAFRAATNQVQVANTALTTAQTRSDDLTRQIKPLTESASTAAVKLEAAKAAVKRSAAELATRNDQMAALAAEHSRLKSAAN